MSSCMSSFFHSTWGRPTAFRLIKGLLFSIFRILGFIEGAGGAIFSDALAARS